MLILASDGITGKNLADYCKKNISVDKALFIITALEDHKENDFCVPRCINELLQFSKQVDLFDFDNGDISVINDYDLICISGGNVFYLLNAVKRSNAQSIIDYFAKNKILIGWSAGACVLADDLEIYYEFEPDDRFGKDFKGLSITDLQIMPHYSNYLHDFYMFEERIAEYEKRKNKKVIRISDGDAIVVDGNKKIIISDREL